MYTVFHIFTMTGGLFKKERENTNKTRRFCYIFLPHCESYISNFSSFLFLPSLATLKDVSKYRKYFTEKEISGILHSESLT